MNEKIKKDIKMPVLITFIIGIIAHSMIFFTEAMAPDALYFGNLCISGKWEISLGRWGLIFLDTIRGGIVNKIFIILSSLIFLGLAVAIVCKIYKIKSKWGVLVISMLFATMPQVSETFMYIYCADSYCLALLASILAVYFIINGFEKKYNFILGIVCGVISLSIYQAYISVSIVLIILYFFIKILKDEIKTKETILKFVISMFSIMIAMICYFVITKIILKFIGIDFASYKGANSLSLINMIKELPMSIKESYLSIYRFLFKDSILLNSFWHRNIYNVLLCLINFIYIIYLLIKKKLYKNIGNTVLLTILIIVTPIAVNIINILMPWNKINIVTGPSLFCIYILFIVLIENTILNDQLCKFIKYINLGLLIILIITYIMSDNATYMSRQEVHINYLTTSNNILQKVYNLDNYSKDKKWIFTDNIRYKSKFAQMANGFISNDYETWNAIDGIWMNRQFYERYLGEKINMASKEEYYDILKLEEVKNMEPYPSNNCVKIIGDYIVIKISDQSYINN